MGTRGTHAIVASTLILFGLLAGWGLPAQAQFESPPNPDDVEISADWTLTADADGDGQPNPGNALSFTIRIRNGASDDIWNTTLTTLLDPQLQLMPDSVETSKGRISQGDRHGDRRLIIEIPLLQPNEAVQVRYDAIIKSPISDGTDQVCSQAWFSFFIEVDPKVSDVACAPIVGRIESPIGGDPPIHGDIQVFPTPEIALNRDLTNDGSVQGTALRYRNFSTGEIVNTGLEVSGAHADTDTYDGVIAFVGANDRIRLYDTATGEVTDVAARGSHPVLNERWVVFEVSGWLQYYDRRTDRLTSPRIPGKDPVLYGNRVVYSWGNPATIRYLDLTDGTTVDTGVVGTHPAIYDDQIAFVTRETDVDADLNGSGYVDAIDVVRTLDVPTGVVTNTGAVGRYPVLWNGVVAFSTPETSVQTDLNGDGQLLGEVIRHYDLHKDRVINTGMLGTEPDIYEDRISFYRWERWDVHGQDVNADGDLLDPVVDVHTITDSHAAFTIERPGRARTSHDGRRSLHDFDGNGNGVIDNPEFLGVIDRWTSGALGDDRFLAALDAWAHGTTLPTRESPTAATSSFSFARASGGHGGVTFAVQSADVREIAVRIYDLSGNRIYRGRSAGGQLTWTLNNAQGSQVANGVYLYRVTAIGPNGQVTQSDVRRLTVLR